MAQAKVLRGTKNTVILVKGNPKSPEPQTTAIKFPGGQVEVTRTTDNLYWVHISMDDDAAVKDSRIDFKFEEYQERVQKRLKEDGKVIANIVDYDKVQHMALLVDGVYKEEGE